MAKSRNYAPYILKRMEVVDLPRCYVLGCGAKRVTVLSQQFRAFNLIWALFAENRLKANDRVGVVGGGIGGLTVAAAAMLAGCKVVLVEERPDLMHIQRVNRTRLLHPNIYEWPHEVAEENETRFPCMNWSADLAERVVLRLDEQWTELISLYSPSVQMNTLVKDIKVTGPEGRLVLDAKNWESSACDVVILAVGFGVERGAAGIELDTYWDNDNFEQPVRGAQVVKRYFISGIGDGGCIDVLRLSYSNFNHDTFVRKAARLKELLDLRSKLLWIDMRMPETGESEYLREEYRKLHFPPDLATRLGTLRTDTYVELNGTDPFPYSPKACILHRVALWGLDMAGHLKYRPGKLNVSDIQVRSAEIGIRYMVPVPGTDGRTSFDTVVMRHGPRARLTEFPGIVSSYKGINDNPAADRTRRQLYPQDFYPTLTPPIPESHRSQPTAVARTRTPSLEFAEPPQPPMLADGTIEPPVGPALVQPTLAPSGRQIRVEELTRRLESETRAQNRTDAQDIANVLESLLTQQGEKLADDVWTAAHTALFDFELLLRSKAQAAGETRGTIRFQELIARAQSGNR